MQQPVTLITGSSKGIGRALAEHYLEAGHLVVGCSRSGTTLTAEGYSHYEVDVAEEAQVKKLFSGLRKVHGRLDNLINNAGIASMNHSLLTPASSVERILRVNTLGTFVVSREAAKLMRRGKYGRIVNFSTVAVPLDLEGEAAYVSSKAGVEALTRVLAREFAVFGITVNVVGPVPIDTDLIKNVPSQKIDELVARQAIKRRGVFEDVVNVIDFFLSPASEFITGQRLYLGGV